ncbi:MAG: alkaline phosphatase family protein [Flavihumibacter sp.]
MKRHVSNRGLVCVLVAGFLLAATALNAQKPVKRKAVFVIADGIPADVLEKVATPHLISIAAKGRYLRAFVGGGKGAYSETPTISAVGYNSLLTGTWANKHNVWDNDIAAPNYNYPSIFRLYKEQYPAGKIAVYSSWLDNRTKLVGDGLPQTGGLRVDYHADGFELDTIRFPHDQQRDFMHRIDETVIDAAVDGIRNQAPDLSWVYLEYTDDMGHMYGDSEPYYKAVQMLDAQMGRLWSAIRYRQQRFGEEWMIVITTDHGRSEKDGKGHGGQSERQRSTWMVTSLANVNAYPNFRKPGIVDIFPTIARFMHLQVPDAVRRELDGIPLTGPVSLIDMQVNAYQGKLDIEWTPFSATDKSTVKIWVSKSNHYKTGGKDDYILAAELPISQRHAVIPLAGGSEFSKVVLEATSNSLNRWVQKPAGAQ